jgi:hypothetical protein
MINVMKTPLSIIFLVALSFSSFASENTISLEKKVNDSDAIAIGKVVSIELGEVGIYTNIPPIVSSIAGATERQMATITFEVTERLYGDLPPQISFIIYSWRFKKDNGDTQRTTVGFNLKCTGGEEYLVYLKKLNGNYYLAFDSCQYFMRVDSAKGLVQILGQDYGEYVPLEERIKNLEKLIKQKKKESQPAI